MSGRWRCSDPGRDKRLKVAGGLTSIEMSGQRDDAEGLDGAEERYQFFVEVGAAFSERLDYDQTLRLVAEIAIPRVADWCSVTAVNQQRAFDRIAVVHRDTAKAHLALEYETLFPPGRHLCGGLGAALHGRQAVLMASARDADLVTMADGDDHLRVLRGLGCSSYIIAPMIARGESVGVISFVRGDDRRPFGPEDVSIAEDIGRRGGLAVENARLYQLAQDAIQVREEFLSLASHELKTPLTGVQLQVSGLQRTLARNTPPDLERVASRVACIDRQLGRLTGLVDGLLELGVSAGRVKIDTAALDAAQVARDVVASASPGPSMTTPDQRDQVVLVVDDDDTIRHALADILSGEGYLVLTARNGEEALAELRRGSRRRPCLILLDMTMPVMNGQEFYEQKQLDPELMAIPVVIMSAERNLRQRAVSFGGAYLAKPARLAAILDTVERHRAV
jgi:CheY-like chemotaxis protein